MLLQPTRSAVRNLLLRALSPQDFGVLQPHLSLALNRGDGLIQPLEPIEHVWFLDDGIASIVANTNDGRRIEVGIYGREGMGGNRRSARHGPHAA